MPKLVLAAIIATMFSGIAHAQFDALTYSLCRKVTSDAARLKCYDEIGASRTDRSSDNNAPTAKAEWQYTVDKSPLDDSVQVTAILQTKDGGGLVLRCKERKTEAISMPAGFFVSGTGDTIPIIIRINDDPPATFSWHKSTNGNAAFAPNAIAFIRLLPDNGKLFIRATGFQGRQADGLFDLSDVSTARTKIEEACNWSAPKPNKATASPSNSGYSKTTRDNLKKMIDKKSAGQ